MVVLFLCGEFLLSKKVVWAGEKKKIEQQQQNATSSKLSSRTEKIDVRGQAGLKNFHSDSEKKYKFLTGNSSSIWHF